MKLKLEEIEKERETDRCYWYRVLHTSRHKKVIKDTPCCKCNGYAYRCGRISQREFTQIRTSVNGEVIVVDKVKGIQIIDRLICPACLMVINKCECESVI